MARCKRITALRFGRWVFKFSSTSEDVLVVKREAGPKAEVPLASKVILDTND